MNTTNKKELKQTFLQICLIITLLLDLYQHNNNIKLLKKNHYEIMQEEYKWNAEMEKQEELLEEFHIKIQKQEELLEELYTKLQKQKIVK